MKKILIPVVAVILGLVAGLVWHSVKTSSNPESFVPYKVGSRKDQVAEKNKTASLPKIELVNGTDYQADEIELNRNYEHEFIIDNTGRGELYLRVVSATDGCSVPTFENGERVVTIGPRKKGFLTLRWNADDASSEEFSGMVRIATNDPYMFDMDFTVKGKIKATAAAIPSRIEFENQKQAESATFEFDAVSFDQETFKILGHEFSDSLIASKFDVAYKPLSADELTAIKNHEGLAAKSGYHVTASMKPGMPIGYFSQRLLLKTDLENRTPLTCRIEGNVVGQLTSRFESGAKFDSQKGLIDFGVVAPGEPSNEVKLTLVFRDGLVVPENLQVLDSQNRPQKFFQLIFAEPQKQSDQLSTVAVTVLIPPSVERNNLMGKELERFGRMVIADGEGNPILVLHGKVLFNEAR